MQSVLSPDPPMLTRAEHLVNVIRLDIVRDVLPAAARLTEQGLAERYGVSRTPVREALRVLARESLLIHAPRCGYVVASVNLDEMGDLYAVRVALEEQVARRLAERGARPALEALLAFWGAPPAGPVSADVGLVFSDEQFHETLAVASGSTVFPPLLRNINQRLHSLRIRDFNDAQRVRSTYEEHAAILRALLGRDERLTCALIRAHIWQSYDFVRSRAPHQECAK